MNKDFHKFYKDSLQTDMIWLKRMKNSQQLNLLYIYKTKEWS